MSKKIAEGIGGLVLDVKTGARRVHEDAGGLAPARRVARRRSACASGVRTEALITAMDAPLGRMVGNSLEVIESIETLKGRGPEDLEQLSVLLAARMLIAAGLERDEAAAEAARPRRAALRRRAREAPAHHRVPGRRSRRRGRLRSPAVRAGRQPVPAPRGGYVTSLARRAGRPRRRVRSAPAAGSWTT